MLNPVLILTMAIPFIFAACQKRSPTSHSNSVEYSRDHNEKYDIYKIIAKSESDDIVVIGQSSAKFYGRASRNEPYLVTTYYNTLRVKIRDAEVYQAKSNYLEEVKNFYSRIFGLGDYSDAYVDMLLVGSKDWKKNKKFRSLILCSTRPYENVLENKNSKEPAENKLSYLNIMQVEDFQGRQWASQNPCGKLSPEAERLINKFGN